MIARDGTSNAMFPAAAVAGQEDKVHTAPAFPPPPWQPFPEAASAPSSEISGGMLRRAAEAERGAEIEEQRPSLRVLLLQAMAEYEREIQELKSEKDFFKQRMEQLESTGKVGVVSPQASERLSPPPPNVPDFWEMKSLPSGAVEPVASSRRSSRPSLPMSCEGSARELRPSEVMTNNMKKQLGLGTPRNSMMSTMSTENILAHQTDLAKKAKYILLFYGGCVAVVPIVFRLWRGHVRYARTPLLFSPHPLWRVQFSHSSSPQSQHVDVELSNLESTNAICESTQQAESSVMKGFGSRFLLSPSSTVRIIWDLTGAVLLGYDIVMIPLSVFGPDKKGFLTFMDWFTLIFWSIDMFLSCITGVIEKGQTVMVPSRILVHYIKSWFCIDVVVVVPDWVFLIMELAGVSDDGSDAADSSKLLRSLRILRVMRLLRLAKLQRIAIMLRDRVDSELSFVLLNILKLVLMLLLLNHFLAATWWGIGSVGRDEGQPNWIDSQDFAPREFAYRYLTALHYAFCMFTPGSMNVQPQNTIERCFAILVLVFGMVIFTSFISSMTAAVGQLKSMQGSKSKDLWMLRRFLRQHAVETDLKYRVLRYADYAYTQIQAKKMVTSKVNAMSVLSDQLRAELNFEVVFSCLNVHPLLQLLRSECRLVVFQLVNHALEQRSLASKDVLFMGGALATHMYIVVIGELQYQKTSDPVMIDLESEEVRPEDWLCENVLWTDKWACLGVARAPLESELVLIKAEAFIQVMCSDNRTKEIASPYAEKVTEKLCRTARGTLSDVSKSVTAKAEISQILEDLMQEFGGFDPPALELTGSGHPIQVRPGALKKALKLSRSSSSLSASEESKGSSPKSSKSKESPVQHSRSLSGGGTREVSWSVILEKSASMDPGVKKSAN